MPATPEKQPDDEPAGAEAMEVELIQQLIRSYFYIVRKNIQDAVPKAVSGEHWWLCLLVDLCFVGECVTDGHVSPPAPRSCIFLSIMWRRMFREWYVLGL